MRPQRRQGSLCALALLLSLPVIAEIRPSKLTASTRGDGIAVTLLVENTNDNTANLDITFQLLSGSKVLTTVSASVAAAPLLTSAVEARLPAPAGTLQIHDL